jgi:hypothetical protein
MVDPLTTKRNASLGLIDLRPGRSIALIEVIRRGKGEYFASEACVLGFGA